MRLHGGSIVIDSAPGRGTVAQACFPDERSVARRSAA
jgi:signal transduction histidine kinase